MKKVTTDLSKVFKKGEAFELQNIDFGSAKVTRQIKAIREIQNKICRSTEVDIAKLLEIVFKI